MEKKLKEKIGLKEIGYTIIVGIVACTIGAYLKSFYGEKGKQHANVEINKTVEYVSNSEEDYIPEISKISKEEFIKANKYFIYAGVFKNKDGADKRLEDIKKHEGYESAEVVHVENEQDNKDDDEYKVIAKKGDGVDSSETQNICDNADVLLHNVISDSKANEKCTFLKVTNEYIYQELQKIDELIIEGKNKEALASINATEKIIKDNSIPGFSGYYEYETKLKERKRDHNL